MKGPAFLCVVGPYCPFFILFSLAGGKLESQSNFRYDSSNCFYKSMINKKILREYNMTKGNYLQMKKQVRVWFTVNIIIALIAIAGGILVIISKSRHIPYLLMCLGAVTLMNQALIYPVFNGKKEAEEAHPEWKELSTNGTEIPMEDLKKGILISAMALLIVIVGFFMFYRPLPKVDAGTELIKTYQEIQSVPENSTEKESSTVSNLSPKDVQTLQELKEEIESNAPSNSNSLDINKAKEYVETAQRENWLKRDK
jgi:hypothetical protein